MITDLCTAIYNKYNGDSTLKAALTGGLYFQQAPDDVATSYAVYYVDGISCDDMMGSASNKIEQMEIRMNTFSTANDGGIIIGGLVKSITDLFDWCSLTITGYTFIKMRRMFVSPILYIDAVWQGTVIYEISYIKS